MHTAPTLAPKIPTMGFVIPKYCVADDATNPPKSAGTLSIMDIFLEFLKFQKSILRLQRLLNHG